MNRLSPTGGLQSYGPNVPNIQRLIMLLTSLLLFLIIFPVDTLKAQVELRSWELQNNLGYEPNGDPALEADLNATGICSTCGQIIRGPGLGIPPTGRLHTIVSNQWDALTLIDAQNLDEYFQFSIEPSNGYGLRLDTLILRLGRTTNGPNRFALFSSVNGNGYVTQIGPDIIVSGTSLVDTIALPSALFGECTSGEAIDFRLYAVEAVVKINTDQAWIGNVGSGGLGNDIFMTGFVESVPQAFTSTVYDTPHCYGETNNLLRRLQVGPNTLPGVNEEVVWRVIGFAPGASSDMSAFV